MDRRWTAQLSHRLDANAGHLDGFRATLWDADVTLWFPCPGAVLVFMPGLAEIKMLYEQLQSNRVFNNRRATRCVFRRVCVCVNSMLSSVHVDSILRKFQNVLS